MRPCGIALVTFGYFPNYSHHTHQYNPAGQLLPRVCPSKFGVAHGPCTTVRPCDVMHNLFRTHCASLHTAMALRQPQASTNDEGIQNTSPHLSRRCHFTPDVRQLSAIPHPALSVSTTNDHSRHSHCHHPPSPSAINHERRGVYYRPLYAFSTCRIWDAIIPGGPHPS